MLAKPHRRSLRNWVGCPDVRDIVFYLPADPLGGGANSVVQEFQTLVKNYNVGWLLTDADRRQHFRHAYKWTDAAWQRVVHNFEGLPDNCLLVATTNSSVQRVLEHCSSHASIAPAYYIQDFEPLFYAKESRAHVRAAASFEAANSLLGVVKTAWLQDLVSQETFLPVTRISPSIDRSVFKVAGRVDRTGGPRRLATMLRPETPRRGPKRTAAVVNRLIKEGPDTLLVDVFGTDANGLADLGVVSSDRVRLWGRLRPRKVAQLLRASDFFLDLSDYQAFGRSVAEGMACGAVPIATAMGAIPEVVRDGDNGTLVNPFNIDESFHRICSALALDDLALASRRSRAVESVAAWSADATAADWLSLMSEISQ